MKGVIKGLLGVAAVTIALAAQTGSASAAWNQNRIIDDNVFTNSLSLSPAQIDTFLNAFPNSCISTNKGFSAPDPTGYTPSGGYTYGGNVSAGKVIAHAAQAYGINPQVLLVTIQKEEGLVRGDGTYGCSTLAISATAGYGCPDNRDSNGNIITYDYSGINLYTLNGTTVTSVNGTCVNSNIKAGFSQQIIRAAWLLKFSQERSEGNVGWGVIKTTTTDASGNAWNSNWDNSDDPQTCYSGAMTAGYRQVCPSGPTTYYDGYTTIDGTAVNMNTGATASLYRYTPHFHGNQLFVSVWEAWWGESLLGTYRWSSPGYQILTADESAFVDPGHLQPGQHYLAKLLAYNTGTATWYKTGPTPTLLGTTAPTAGPSQFCVPAKWIACTRPGGLVEDSVAPGGAGHFMFEFQAPFSPGDYRESFKPLAEMLAWTNDIYEQSFGIHVDNPGTFKWWTPGYKILDRTESVYMDPGRLQPGEVYLAVMDAYNTGTATWFGGGATPVVLGNPGGNSQFCLPNSWISCTRPARLVESSVPPGGLGHFRFLFRAPFAPGEYHENFKPLAEMLSWTNDTGAQNFGIKVVNPGTYKWATDGYQILTANESAFMDPGHLQANTTYLAKLIAYNTGTATWLRDSPTPMMLGTTNPNGRNSNLCIPGWVACTRPAHMVEASVPPGGYGHFMFQFKTPATPGTYREDFKPLAEMLSWTNDAYGQTFGIVVY
ncbi:MAG TPA: hypothetical protein VLH86_01680 [Patescibacteria group bacterium]|nr:hypothetical protein [Patescibacteria group bacterium]